MSFYLPLLTPPRFHRMKGPPRLHTSSRVAVVGTALSQAERGSLGAVWRWQDTERLAPSRVTARYSKLVVPFGLRDGFNV